MSKLFGIPVDSLAVVLMAVLATRAWARSPCSRSATGSSSGSACATLAAGQAAAL